MPGITRTDDELRDFIVLNSIRTLTGCWEWLGRLNLGYGKLSYHGRSLYLHQVSYLLFVGPLIPGLTIDHLCRNRACGNPAHLEQVPRGVNVLRGEGVSAKNARKTHCPRGHPYDIIRKNGGRWCSKCSWVSGTRREYNPDPDYQRNYYLANQEKLKKQSNEWYHANKDQAQETGRKYREKNKARIAEKKRKWRAEQRRLGRRVT